MSGIIYGKFDGKIYDKTYGKIYGKTSGKISCKICNKKILENFLIQRKIRNFTGNLL